VVNARQVATGRSIEVIESRSSRPRDFANMLSLKLHTTEGERWIEGAVFEPNHPRLTLLDGVEVEAPLEGLLLIIRNDDQPGVIGEIGTVLGRHGINIANFALGRGRGGAVGVVNLDETSGSETRIAQAIEELRALAPIRDVRLVRL
jgi:D-3-phosphoglycerate dehydrogenase